MKWIYLGLWLGLTLRDSAALWRAQAWRALTVWLLLAGLGLGLALWYFWGNTPWRLADWLTALGRM